MGILKTSATEKAQKRVSEVLAVYDGQMSSIEENIAKAQDGAKTAEARKEAAAQQLDAASYQQADADLQQAHIQLEMYERRRKELQSGPLISEDEYNSLCDGIDAELDQVKEAAAKKLVALVGQMDVIVADLEQKANAANAALHAVQGKAYRNANVQKGFGIRGADADDFTGWLYNLEHRTVFEEWKGQEQ